MSLLHLGGSSADDKLYVEDVFSTYLYTGNGSTQTITNGIDLAGKGGMVWTKVRNYSSGYYHSIQDTVRGFSNVLSSNLTNASSVQDNSITGFNGNGYSLGSDPSTWVNGGGDRTYVSWTFRRAPKFFDVVTYTGNGVSGRQIPHNLGCEVGMLVVRPTNVVEDWSVWHRSLTGADKLLVLNTTAAVSTHTTYLNNTLPNSTHFTVGNNNRTNTSGQTYVAYLFANDPSADGIIQCGSFTTDASGNATVNLGCEPQYVMYKRSNGTSGWYIVDIMRGLPVSATPSPLYANQSASETSGEVGINPFSLTPTGFQTVGCGFNSSTFIYLAIRRPMKTPTSGSEVYISHTAIGSTNTVRTTGFPIDMQLLSNRTATNLKHLVVDRLRGVNTVQSTVIKPILATSSTGAEDTVSYSATNNFSSNGFMDSAWTNGQSTIWHSFKRAKGFFDVVCYTGSGVARTVNHNLGVVPELMIVKKRSGTTGTGVSGWVVYQDKYAVDSVNYPVENTGMLLETTNAAFAASNLWNTKPTSNLFYLSTASAVNETNGTFVAYLFASLDGISKVGSYVGNGTSQTINCGFSAGARFVLIKRTASTGDWYVWDTARGIVAANDPHLSLNTTAAEVTTDDSVDPESTGFIVNQNTATNINVNGGTYIYYSIS